MDITKFGQNAMNSIYSSCSNPNLKGKATITVKNMVVHKNSSVSEKRSSESKKPTSGPPAKANKKPTSGPPAKANKKSIAPAKTMPGGAMVVKKTCGKGKSVVPANSVNKNSVVPFKKPCTSVSNKKAQPAGKKQGTNATAAAKSTTKRASTFVKEEQVVKMTIRL